MKKIFIAIFALTSMLFAKELFVLNEKVDLLNDSKQVVGQIYEGTTVKVLKTAGGLTQIEIDGKVDENNKQMLSYTKTGFFTFLKMSKGTPKDKMTFWVDSKALTPDIGLAWEEIELTYYDTCSACHSAHKPAEHTMEEWPALIGAMQGMAKITDAQRDRILRFLQAHASDGPDKGLGVKKKKPYKCTI